MSVLALTTTYMPASSCLTDVYLYYTGVTSYYYSLGPPDTSNCFPSGWQSVTTAYFSPGVCPLGYNIACSSHNSIGTLTETTATCCPPNYICFTPGTPWFTGEACLSEITSGVYMTVTTTNSQSSGTTKTSLYLGDGINAFGVIIRYQSSDFITTGPSSILSVTPMPTSPSTANTPTASSSSSPSTTTLTAPGATSGNTGRNIGIGVGVSLGSIGILSGIFAIWLVRRRRSESHNIGGPQEVAYTRDRSGGNTQQPVSAHEMQASKPYPAYEMPASKPYPAYEMQ